MGGMLESNNKDKGASERGVAEIVAALHCDNVAMLQGKEQMDQPRKLKHWVWSGVPK
jgi:hypothetical protein